MKTPQYVPWSMTSGKLPDSFGAVDTSAPVQSIDIAPTILKSLDIEPHAFEGLPLSEPINRNKTFFVHDYYGKPKQISRYQYRDQEWTFIERFDVDLR